MSDETQQTPLPERYDAQAIEKKWFERWASDDTLYQAEANSTKKKYYVLEMLPYPSGALHMGHVRNYAIGDALEPFVFNRLRVVALRKGCLLSLVRHKLIGF